METSQINGTATVNVISTTPAVPVQGMRTEVMLVTPEMAAEWLKNNRLNRPVDRAAVTRLADAIRGGRWMLTHQGPALGADGSLLDGQHRLLAIIAAGIAVPMLVTTNVPRATVGVIDIGGCGVRRPHHVLAMMGVDVLNGTARAAAIAAARIVNGISVTGQDRMDPERLADALRQHGNDAMLVASTIGSAHNRLCQAPSNGALTVLHAIYPKETAAFIEMLRTGEGLTERHPALAMRDYLTMKYNGRQHAGEGRDSRTDLVDRMFGAFDAYRRGSPRLLSRPSPAAREAAIDLWKATTNG